MRPSAPLTHSYKCNQCHCQTHDDSHISPSSAIKIWTRKCARCAKYAFVAQPNNLQETCSVQWRTKRTPLKPLHRLRKILTNTFLTFFSPTTELWDILFQKRSPTSVFEFFLGKNTSHLDSNWLIIGSLGTIRLCAYGPSPWLHVLLHNQCTRTERASTVSAFQPVVNLGTWNPGCQCWDPPKTSFSSCSASVRTRQQLVNSSILKSNFQNFHLCPEKMDWKVKILFWTFLSRLQRVEPGLKSRSHFCLKASGGQRFQTQHFVLVIPVTLIVRHRLDRNREYSRQRPVLWGTGAADDGHFLSLFQTKSAFTGLSICHVWTISNKQSCGWRFVAPHRLSCWTARCVCDAPAESVEMTTGRVSLTMHWVCHRTRFQSEIKLCACLSALQEAAHCFMQGATTWAQSDFGGWIFLARSSLLLCRSTRLNHDSCCRWSLQEVTWGHSSPSVPICSCCCRYCEILFLYSYSHL